MFKPLLILGFAGAANPAHATPTDLAGVWTGTLGKAAITACFNASPDSNGSYYYKRFLTPIQLSREHAGEPWVEQGNSGAWHLHTPHDNTLTGTWSNPAGGKPLPVVLTRTDAGGCASDAYNLPLESAPLPVHVEKASVGTHRYQVKTQGAEVTLTLEGEGQPLQQINRHLAQLAVSPEGQAEFFRERREYLGRNGSAHTSEIEVEPIYWSSHWVTVKFYRWTAGYGRSGISWGLHSWNVQTGERVDPWTWFGSHQTWDDPYSAQVKLSPAFSAWLQQQTSTDPGCPAISSYSRFDLNFDTHGVQLSTPSYGDGCDNELSFTWAQLEPVLSAQGMAALPSLKAP